MTSGHRVEPLGSQRDKSTFASDVPALDRYLREQAGQDMKRLVASCFVLVDGASGRVAGYYTLAATSVPTEDISQDILRKLPRYPVLPGALMGRLAVDRAFKGRGLGSALVADAAIRILRGDVKAFAMVVDAKDARAESFYLHQGFQQFASQSGKLYLPLSTFAKALSGS